MAGPVASAKESTLVIIEVVDSPEDPLALEDAAQLELTVQVEEERILALERKHVEKLSDRDRHRADIRKRREALAEVKKRLSERRAAVSSGMCLIHGWDGIRGAYVHVECRGPLRARARGFKADQLIDYDTTRPGATRGGVSTVFVKEATLLRPRQVRPRLWKAPPGGPHPWARDPVDDLAALRLSVKEDLYRSILPTVVIQVSAPSGVRLVRALVHVHMLDASGSRVGRLTPTEGAVVRAPRYSTSMRHAITRYAGQTPAPTALAIRLPAPPVAPEGGYEVEVVEAVRRVK